MEKSRKVRIVITCIFAVPLFPLLSIPALIAIFFYPIMFLNVISTHPESCKLDFKKCKLRYCINAIVYPVMVWKYYINAEKYPSTFYLDDGNPHGNS